MTRSEIYANHDASARGLFDIFLDFVILKASGRARLRHIQRSTSRRRSLLAEEAVSSESWTSRLSRERVVVAPSLLAADFANLESEIRKLEAGGAQVLHIDVMDGRLVPNISFGVPVVSAIRKVTTLKLDVHLMIVEPERYVEAFRAAGADSLSIHIEAVPDPTELLGKIRDLGAAPGLVLDCGTPISAILPYVELADILLTMSVPAGFGGQAFHAEVLDSIRTLRRLARPDALIEIDGGIDVETIGAAAVAGVNMFVSGTSVFRASNYGDQMTILKKAAFDALANNGERLDASFDTRNR